MNEVIAKVKHEVEETKALSGDSMTLSVETVDDVIDYYESASVNFYHATKKHAEFLNRLWEIMGFPYEWEYPGQAERHIEERLKEVVRESGAKMVLPD